MPYYSPRGAPPYPHRTYCMHGLIHICCAICRRSCNGGLLSRISVGGCRFAAPPIGVVVPAQRRTPVGALFRSGAGSRWAACAYGPRHVTGVSNRKCGACATAFRIASTASKCNAAKAIRGVVVPLSSLARWSCFLEPQFCSCAGHFSQLSCFATQGSRKIALSTVDRTIASEWETRSSRNGDRIAPKQH